MPTTPQGLPYPDFSAVPDVPFDLQKLAETIDPRLTTAIAGHGVSRIVNNSAVLTDDPGWRWTCPRYGFYRIEMVTGYSCSAVGADVQQAWRTSGDCNLHGRFTLGPELAAASVASTLMAARPAGLFTTPQAFGVISGLNNHIREDLLVEAGAGTYLQFQFAQNVATAADLTRYGYSYMVVTPVGIA